jgi:Xaa-Pro aminopeptidase
VINATTYRSRRDVLRPTCSGSALLFPGHSALPRNYRDNVFPFRQNSHVLYYCGVARPGVALVVTDDGDVLFGAPEDVDDVIWHGPHETLREAAAKAGIEDVRDVAELPAWIGARRGRVRFLPPFQGDVKLGLAALLGIPVEELAGRADPELAAAVAAQRERKSADEIAQMEQAHAVTHAQHLAAFRAVRPGVRESEVVAAMLAPALAADLPQAYNPIVTVRGEVLHNGTYRNELRAGQLLLNDSGVESELGYCSDVTRTCPVGGRFTAQQREIYEVVLRAQLGGIAAAAPGVENRAVHRVAARIIAEGLRAVGLMRGDPEEAVAAGAHALFYPHGIGHMIGLDVHDMEDLGDVVGYERGAARSPQFGFAYLRLAKRLEPGFVVTIEPGIYFIPALIERWRAEERHAAFIAYERLDRYRDFGGIRIEDDVLITADGRRVLGPGVPKEAAEVEAAALG